MSLHQTHTSFNQTQLIILTGCGGVGKTTVSASFALSLAQKHTVALITIDPAKRLAQSLNLHTTTHGLQPVKAHPNLWAMMIDRVYSSHKLVERCAHSPQAAQQILENPFFKAFSHSLAGVQEYMAIYEVYSAIESKRFEYIVVDTPPAKHAIDFFDTPRKLQDALNNQALQFVLQSIAKPNVKMQGIRQRFSRMGKSLFIKALSTMTADSFVEDLLQFIMIFSEVLKGLQHSAQQLDLILQNQHCHYMLITTTEPSVVQATLQLAHQLQTRHYNVQQVLINRDRQHIYEPVLTQSLHLTIEDEPLRADLQRIHQQIHKDFQQQQSMKDRLSTLKIPTTILPAQTVTLSPYECIVNLVPHCQSSLQSIFTILG